MFGADWIAEFEKLQSNVPQVPEDKLPALLIAALGEDHHTLFASFDMQPVGAGSIAQVHRAVLHDGTEVAVKLRRPGITEKIEADLRVLGHLATLIESEILDSRRYQPTLLVKHFARSLRRELDMEIEARSMERFSRDFADDPHLVIPKVYWPYTNPAVNVQDFINGVPATHLERLADEGLDGPVLARLGADAVLKMILINGFFHADPHPGNVFFLDNEHIALIDFGMVGRLSQIRRDEIVRLLAALGERNEQGMLDVLVEWTGNDPIDEARFTDDISEMLFSYEHMPLKDLNLTELINDTMALIRQDSIVLPPEMAMLIKALITLEGLGRQLDPQLQLVQHMTPFVRD